MKTSTLLILIGAGVLAFTLMPKMVSAAAQKTGSTAGSIVASVPLGVVEGIFTTGYNTGVKWADSLRGYLGLNG